MLIQVPGYKIRKEVYQSRKNLIYQGFRQDDHQPIVLKALNNDYPPSENIAWPQHELEVIQHLNMAGVSRIFDLCVYKKNFGLATEQASEPQDIHHNSCKHRPDLPPALRTVILKMMVKNAEDRYQSAHGLLHDVEQCRKQRQTDSIINCSFKEIK